jgi:diketogulonate reductase-like aldo/keto reductase
LDRVGIGSFDLYYIHWREEKFDLADCMKALEELVDEGKIKNIGVSNFSTESLKEAQSYCKKYKIVANQVHYNLIFREPESDGLLQYCQDNDVMLVSFRPLEL